MDLFNLKDKVILVVGGRGHLGRDICRALYEHNASVISADLEGESSAVAKAKPRRNEAQIAQLNVDVTEKESIVSLIGTVLSLHGRIDGFIYSVTAKPQDFYAPYTECSLDGWQHVIQVELDGLFLASQEVGKVMQKQSNGSIILISSIYGVVGNDQRIYEGSNLGEVYLKDNPDQKQVFSHSVYPVVKGGILSLSRYLAAYWGEKNIRINCISPGGIEHPGENATFVNKYSQKVPLGRKAKLREISGAAVYLSSDSATYITGQNIIIDGGWTIW